MTNSHIKIPKILFALYMRMRNALFSMTSISLARIPGDPGANHDVAEEALNGGNKTRHKVRITHGGKMSEMRTANVEYIYRNDSLRNLVSNSSANRISMCDFIYIYVKMTHAIHNLS